MPVLYMKPLLVLFLLLGFCARSFSQAGDEDKAAAEKEKKIMLLAAKATDSLKLVLTRRKVLAVESEFILDTFRIERIMSLSIGADQTTVGMVDATYAGAKRYDSLLNKYYKKLSAKLTPPNKAALLQAQKSWLAFRDSEMKLNQALGADGGTAAGLNAAGLYLTLIKTRVSQLFDYYEEWSGEL